MSILAVPMAAHDEYGASSAKRWTSCLGSVRLCAQCPPSQDSEWGDEGRQAHDLAEAHLLLGRHVEAADNVSAEMARAINIYIEHVYDILRNNPGSILRVENRVKVPSAIVPGRMGGTYDARIYIPALKRLHILDYKHGAGIYVSEEDNLQMDVYAIASLFEMNEPVDDVVVTIIQPRCFQAGGAVREKTRTVAELLLQHVWFEERAALTQDPNAPLVPTPDNCRWCAAGGYGMCPVAETTAIAMFDPTAKNLREITPPDPKRMSIEQMSYLMANEKLFGALMKNVRMTATGIVRNGGDFPGWKMVMGDPERAWHGNHATIAETVMALTGKTLDEIMPRTLITLTEVENMLVDLFRNGVTQFTGETKKAFKIRQNTAAQLARETLAFLTLREPRGAPRLVPITDPRPALETAVPHFAGQINLEGLTHASAPR